jgi:hypothetical protein
LLAHILIARRFLTGANRARNQIIVVEAGPRTSSWSCRSAGRGRRLLGLAANALASWWWMDPLAGLAVAALAFREGIEAWRSGDLCPC